MGKKDFFADCLGTVTILTDDLVIFQGQIVHEERHHEEHEIEVEVEPEFVELKLECTPVVVSLTGATIHFAPLAIYRVPDVVRINVDEIISVGPGSVGCITPGC